MTVQPESAPEPEIFRIKLRWTEKVTYEHTFEVHSDDVREALDLPAEDLIAEDVQDYLTEGDFLTEGELFYKVIDSEIDDIEMKSYEVHKAGPRTHPAQLALPEETA